MSKTEFVLVNVNNTFTKIAFSSRAKLGKILRVPTRTFTARVLQDLLKNKSVRHAVAASVVPSKNAALRKALPSSLCWVGSKADLGIGIKYPKPETIGADRLANAVAARELYGAPAVVVDFGTAVTFDVVTPRGDYVGGVIAPGLHAMTDYLHDRTALLPRITTLKQPKRAIGRSTREAMQSGVIHGYRGLVAEILREILKEIPSTKPLHIIVTGGHARLIAGHTGLFTAVAPTLTMEGLRLIGCRNFPA